MKKIQPIKIVVVVVTVLVFCIALAVPCFADSAPQSLDISKAVRVDSVEDMQALMNCVTLDKYYPVSIQIPDLYEWYLHGTAFIYEDSIEIYVSDFSASERFIDATSIVIYGDPSGELTYTKSWYRTDDNASDYSYVTDSFDLITNMIVYDVYTETPPTDSGWYGDIKNIIKDAVFGENASLDDSQRFTLNQISLWLTIIVVLLPLVVVGVILVRCFR